MSGSPAGTYAAEEICNHVDDDGDGLVDEGFAQVIETARAVDATWNGNFLGRALAALGDIDGDGINDLAIGYPADHTDGSWRGSVIVISGGDRTEHCRAFNDDLQAGGELGNQVVALGDIDGDDVPDFAAAAYHSDRVAYNAGEVILFSGVDCSVLRHCADPAGAPEDQLGEENGLARVEDLDGDGVPEIVAGAGRANTSGLSDAGKAVVFSGADCSVIRTLVDPDPAAYDFLGFAVAGLEDVSGDGVPDIAVGEHRADDVVVDGGAVLIFSGADGSLVRRLTDPAASVADYLGWAIAPIDDLDDDGRPDVAISARNRPPTGAWYEVGEVIAFAVDDGEVLWRGYDPAWGVREYLGWSLATVPDMTGDGVREVLAGVPYGDSPDHANQGRAVLLSGSDGTYVRSFHHPFAQPSDLMGFAVLGPGDLNGDGAPDIVVGVSHDDDPKHGTDRGSVLFLYPESDCDGDGAGPTGVDCDDTLAVVRGGAVELCDGLDNDCDGAVDEDEDGDLFDVCEELAACGPDDEPWNDRGIHPLAEERCNGIDDDCNGLVDDGPDSDGDQVAWPCDCDDGDAMVHPSAVEICNHVADACGAVDAGFDQATSLESHVDRLAGTNDRFGWAVAGIGDVTGDAVFDFAVSSPWDQTLGAGAGMVVVVSGADRTVWCRTSEPIGGAPGTVLAGVPDWDGDGVPDIAASTPGANGAVVLSGADCREIVRCTESVPGSWNLGSNHGMAAWFDVTDGGAPGLVLGSASNVEREHHQGKAVAFRYDRPTGTCSVRYPMWDPDGVAYDNLGYSVTAIDDVTGDGVPDVAAGEPGDDSIATNAGSVLVFSGADGSFVRRMLDPEGAANHKLGVSIAGIRDADGDGVGEIVAGSWADRVVLFSGRDGTVLRTLIDPSGTDGERLGDPVAAIGDVDGDGLDDVVSGATYADVGGVVDAGRVVVLSVGTGGVVRQVAAESNVVADRFGFALGTLGDVSGDRVSEILIGAPYSDVDGRIDVGRFAVVALESDCDQDGIAPFGGDCDDTRADLWSLPGEARDVVFDDDVTLTWLAPLESGTAVGTLQYDVVRAGGPAGFDASTCVEIDDVDLTAVDLSAPDPRGGFYYLVRAANDCGEGDLGDWGEEGVPRTASSCP